jgi:hypothetical protein
MNNNNLLTSDKVKTDMEYFFGNGINVNRNVYIFGEGIKGRDDVSEEFFILMCHCEPELELRKSGALLFKKKIFVCTPQWRQTITSGPLI